MSVLEGKFLVNLLAISRVSLPEKADSGYLLYVESILKNCWLQSQCFCIKSKASLLELTTIFKIKTLSSTICIHCIVIAGRCYLSYQKMKQNRHPPEKNPHKINCTY